MKKAEPETEHDEKALAEPNLLLFNKLLFDNKEVPDCGILAGFEKKEMDDLTCLQGFDKMKNFDLQDLATADSAMFSEKKNWERAREATMTE